MQELNFNNILMWIEYAELQCRSRFKSEISSPKNISTPSDFENIWEQLVRIVEQVIPGNFEIVKNWKSDLFMSLYTAFTYNTPGLLPLTSKSQIADFIAQQTIYSTKSNYRNDMAKHFKILKEEYSKPHIWQQSRKNTDLEYFKSVWNTEEKFKVFNSYDFYFYLKAFKKWPFYHKNENGVLLSEWYSFIEELFTLISNYNENSGMDDFEKQFSYYIFEQFFYPCRLITTLSKQLDISCKFFHNISDPHREQSIVFITTLAELPSISIEKLLNNFSSTLLHYLELQSDAEKKNYIFLYQKLFSYVRYTFYFFPLCQTLLANLMYAQYPDFNKKTSHKRFQQDLCNYITQNISQYDYKTMIMNSLKHFSKITYPSSGRTNEATTFLTQKPKNNFTLESFNYNFTHLFYYNTSKPNFFDLIIEQNKSKEETAIKDERFLLDNAREATLKKTSSILQCANNITDSYTYNFFMIKKPKSLIPY